ncbi:hypothetical protein AB0D10_42070 [Kitasatospora sp. NPDC048545]|uniref:hypothetical protein n=1 Tax=Kitasatospora sp. NPDC048545 TaxID=3157208 RepID=UPI003402813E
MATCLLRMLDQSTPPLQQSLVGALAQGGERVRTMALVRSVRNTALSAGFLVAGLALAVHTSPAMMAMLIGNGLSFFVLAAVIASLPLRPRPPLPHRAVRARPRGAPVRRCATAASCC